ncbi:MAG: hypothetical protein V7L27_30995 [Nostoc sp.]|uniref:hypothetical protein n=1 Tax=Nostoc sp. TaxID=1180 RepID=UPI002FF6F281
MLERFSINPGLLARSLVQEGKSKKKECLFCKLSGYFKWLVYLRRVVLVSCTGAQFCNFALHARQGINYRAFSLSILK